MYYVNLLSILEKKIDVRNRVETSAQLNSKTKVTRQQFRRYMRYVDAFSRDSFSSDNYSDSDDDSLTNNAPNTEQNLFSDDETEKTTAENLIIDENVDTTKLIRYLTHKIQTIKKKQITKFYFEPCSCRT